MTIAAAPLLLLPGLMCDARIWAPQLEAFAALDPVVVDYGLADSFAAMARIALAAAPPRFALAGHSMGGRVALEIWRRAPERVERLALLDTGVHLPHPGEAEKRHALLALGRARGAEALVDAWLPPMIGPALRDSAAFVAPLRAMCVEAGVDRYAAQIAALLGRPEVESLLPAIACPTLVATGRLDAWSPVDQHEAIAVAIPGATLTIFEESGHMAPVEAPGAVNAAFAEWLARPAGPRYARPGAMAH